MSRIETLEQIVEAIKKRLTVATQPARVQFLESELALYEKKLTDAKGGKK